MTASPNGLPFESLPALPLRPEAGHKGSFGTVLVIGDVGVCRGKCLAERCSRRARRCALALGA
jgi:NAD(P)H-hydrate repair Nnr-like enzyme with NAD(P)H-hydrate dehydratase domain